MFGGFSMGHLLVVLVIVLLVFGTKRLKTLGGDLGSAIKGFKNALSDDKSEGNKDAEVVASEPKRVVTEEKDPFNNTTTANTNTNTNTNTTEPVKSTAANSDPK